MPCVSANNAFYNKKEIYKFEFYSVYILIYEKIKLIGILEAEQASKISL